MCRSSRRKIGAFASIFLTNGEPNILCVQPVRPASEHDSSHRFDDLTGNEGFVGRLGFGRFASNLLTKVGIASTISDLLSCTVKGLSSIQIGAKSFR